MSAPATIVIGSDGQAMTPAEIDLSLAAIFSDRALVRRLAAAVAGQAQPPRTLGELLAAAKAEIIRMTTDPGALRFNPPSLLPALAAYARRVSDNADVYNMRAKANPAGLFWPNPTRGSKRSLYDMLPVMQPIPLVGAATQVGVIGGGFARRLAEALGGRGHAVKTVADDVADMTAGLRQMAARELSGDRPSDLRSFLEGLDMLLVVMARNEHWVCEADGAVVADEVPEQDQLPALAPRVPTVAETADDLRAVIELARRTKAGLPVLLSVSPEAPRATLRADDLHVIAAASHAKAVLRAAAEAVAESDPAVHYLPAFETVTMCTRAPWAADERHASDAAMDGVCRLFEAMFAEPAP